MLERSRNRLEPTRRGTRTRARGKVELLHQEYESKLVSRESPTSWQWSHETTDNVRRRLCVKDERFPTGETN